MAHTHSTVTFRTLIPTSTQISIFFSLKNQLIECRSTVNGNVSYLYPSTALEDRGEENTVHENKSEPLIYIASNDNIDDNSETIASG